MSKPLLDGHVAAVSGGQGDIGRAICHALQQSGARASAGDVREGSAGSHQALVDVADPESVAAWFDGIERELGVADLIIANAAVVTLSGAMELPAATWEREIAINLTGAYYVAREGAQRLMHSGKPGRIVFLGSWVADRPAPHITAYSVSKAGLRMLMRCLAIELAPHGILVNEVAPGNVDAGVSAQVFRDRPELRSRALDQARNGELISAEEVAAEVARLCDPALRHAVGSVITLDGGLSLGPVRPKRG